MTSPATEIDQNLHDKRSDSSVAERLKSNAHCDVIEDQIQANGSDRSVAEPLKSNGDVTEDKVQTSDNINDGRKNSGSGGSDNMEWEDARESVSDQEYMDTDDVAFEDAKTCFSNSKIMHYQDGKAEIRDKEYLENGKLMQYRERKEELSDNSDSPREESDQSGGEEMECKTESHNKSGDLKSNESDGSSKNNQTVSDRLQLSMANAKTKSSRTSTDIEDKNNNSQFSAQNINGHDQVSTSDRISNLSNHNDCKYEDKSQTQQRKNSYVEALEECTQKQCSTSPEASKHVSGDIHDQQMNRSHMSYNREIVNGCENNDNKTNIGDENESYHKEENLHEIHQEEVQLSQNTPSDSFKDSDDEDLYNKNECRNSSKEHYNIKGDSERECNTENSYKADYGIDNEYSGEESNEEDTSRKSRSTNYKHNLQPEKDITEHDDQNIYDDQNSLDGTECVDNKPEYSPVPINVFAYKKHYWESYIACQAKLPDWEDDSKDPFERALAHSKFGSQKQKFYRDLTAFDHHDEQQDTNWRGWNKDQCAYIWDGSTAESDWAEKRSDGESFPENFTSDESDTEVEQIAKGGARPKTYVKHEPRIQGRYQEFVHTQNDDTSDAKYRSYKELTNRRHSDSCSEHEETSQGDLKYSLERAANVGSMAFKVDSSADGVGGDFQNRPHDNWKDSSPVHSNQHNENSTPSFASSELEEKDLGDINLHDIVNFLSEEKSFCCNIKTILDIFGTLGSVKNVITQNSHIFHIKGHTVELKPNLLVCPDYLSSNGCLQRSTCRNLHICNSYILNTCNDDGCVMGHNLQTGHNSRALSHFCMEKLKPIVIHGILQSVLTRPDDLQPLEVCEEYNIGNCKDSNCSALHMCIDYVSGLTDCCRPNCTLNHDLQAHNCFRMLNSHGINISSLSEYDGLLKVIENNSKLVDLVQAYEQSGKSYSQALHQNSKSHQTSKTFISSGAHVSSVQATSTGPSHSGPKKLTNKRSSSEGSSKNTQTQSSKGAISSTLESAAKPVGQNANNFDDSRKPNEKTTLMGAAKNMLDKYNPFSGKGYSLTGATGTNCVNQERNDKKPTNNTSIGTVWSYSPQGDTQIAEVCFHALRNVCNFESTGCKRIHSKLPFHWQFQVSKVGIFKAGSWINLQEHQVIHLEQQYCDPHKEIVSLPPTDKTSRPTVLPIFLYQDSCFANFQYMQLFNSTMSEQCILRRLCVETKIKDVKSNQWLWYFKDNSGNWVQYGNTDTTGDSRLATSISSFDIEKHYLKCRRYMNFKNKMFDYTLDFNAMTQTNRGTGVVREVRRRPKPQANLTHNNQSGRQA